MSDSDSSRSIWTVPWTFVTWAISALAVTAQVADASITIPHPVTVVEAIRGRAGEPDWLFTIDEDGQVGRVRIDPEAGLGWEPVTRLPDPQHALVAFADVLGLGRSQLVVVDPRGAAAYICDERGGLASEPTVLARRARNSLRTGRPMLVDLTADLNGDGRLDLLIPGVQRSQIWLQRDPAPDAGGPRFERASEVTREASVATTTESAALSDVLESLITIPRLEIRDWDGNGRPDLLTTQGAVRRFHLQRADGLIPEEPDVTLDLSLFRDTTPRATVEPGRTLAGGDDAVYQSRDLNGDGIPDHVIAHRRKIWVFHGTPAGPQFHTPKTILVAADDVTLLLLPQLDADPYPDLLALRVQVPTTATLILGMMGEFTVDVSASGYLSKQGDGFQTSPSRRGQIVFRLPSLARILRDPGAIISRFEGIGRVMRPVISGDLDGDGRADAALSSKDESGIEVWFGGDSAPLDRTEGDARLRRVFFDDPDRSWDLDRLIGWLEDHADDQAHQATGGRSPDRRLPVRALENRAAVQLLVADLDGDGRDEAIVIHRLRGSVVLDVTKVGR